MKYLEARVGELEKEKRALSMTLENNQSHLDKLISKDQTSAVDVTSQQAVNFIHMFEKDIMGLANSMINEMKSNKDEYTNTHVCQDIQSLQKLIGVCFTALRKGQFNKIRSDQNQNEIGTSLESMQRYKDWVQMPSSDSYQDKHKTPNGKKEKSALMT